MLLWIRSVYVKIKNSKWRCDLCCMIYCCIIWTCFACLFELSFEKRASTDILLAQMYYVYLIKNTHHRKTFHPRWYSVLDFFLAKRGYIRCSTLCLILDSWRSIFSRIIYHLPPYNVYFVFWYFYENKIWNKLLPSIKILGG